MKNLEMKKEFKVIADLLPSNIRVLDVGCGDNLIAQQINLKKFKSYTGFDINIKKEVNSKNYRIFKYKNL